MFDLTHAPFRCTLINVSLAQPCACLALWRIDRVDFEGAAVFPELPVEEAIDKVKLMLSTMGSDLGGDE